MYKRQVQTTEPENNAEEEVEEVETEEVTNYAEIIPAATPYETFEPIQPAQPSTGERKLSDLSKEELFDKLQNYKKLLDNGLITVSYTHLRAHETRIGISFGGVWG